MLMVHVNVLIMFRMKMYYSKSERRELKVKFTRRGACIEAFWVSSYDN